MYMHDVWRMTCLAVRNVDSASLCVLEGIYSVIEFHHGEEYHSWVLRIPQHCVGLASTCVGGREQITPAIPVHEVKYGALTCAHVPTLDRLNMQHVPMLMCRWTHMGHVAM